MTIEKNADARSPAAGPPRAVDDRWGTSYLRDILDINPHLVFAKDREGRFTLVNKTIADIYGAPVEELIGKKDADFNEDEEEVAFFRQIDLQVMDTLEEVVIPEEVITDSQGRRRWLQTVKRPIIGKDGKANQVLAKHAEQVYVLIAGLPMQIKGAG